MRKKRKRKEKEKNYRHYLHVSCGPLVKISSKTHVICAVYVQIAVRTSFAQICPRSRPIFPVFVQDTIPTTSNQQTLGSSRVCRARHKHEINAFRERSGRIMYQVCAYEFVCCTWQDMLRHVRVHSCREKTQSLRSTKDATEAINFHPESSYRQAPLPGARIFESSR